MSRRADIDLGVALPLEDPLTEVIALAAEAEELGYGYLWVNDDRLQKDPFATLAALAAATERVRLGPGVTNPYSRHPALIASAAATLDELSGGRAVLGLGAGGTNHRALGVRRTAPATALREAVTIIRGLLAGEEMTLDGRAFRVRDARLDFEPPRRDLPVFIGARGPRVLELAGAVADGVIVGNVAGPEGWTYALERIASGVRRAGRTLDDVELVAWLYACVDDDAGAALDAIRPMVATSLVTSRPVLADLGIEMPSAFASAMEARGWSVARDVVADTGRLVPEDTVRRFSLAGTPTECRARIADLLAAVPRISQVAIVPFGARGRSRAETVRRFAREVAAAAQPAAVREA